MPLFLVLFVGLAIAQPPIYVKREEMGALQAGARPHFRAPALLGASLTDILHAVIRAFTNCK